ncbi:hypothetical protein K100096D8_26950 [Eggerthella lenta]
MEGSVREDARAWAREGGGGWAKKRTNVSRETFGTPPREEVRAARRRRGAPHGRRAPCGTTRIAPRLAARRAARLV